MSMKQPKFWIAGLLGVTLLGGTLAALHSQQAGRGRRAFGWGGLPPDRALKRLGLTEEQRAEVKKLRESHQAAMSSLRKKGAGIRTQLREKLGTEESSATQVGELVKEGHDLRQQIRKARQSARKSFSDLLTAEQREKIQRTRAQGSPVARPSSRPGSGAARADRGAEGRGQEAAREPPGQDGRPQREACRHPNPVAGAIGKGGVFPRQGR